MRLGLLRSMMLVSWLTPRTLPEQVIRAFPGLGFQETPLPEPLYKRIHFFARFELFRSPRTALCMQVARISHIYMLSERENWRVFGSFLLEFSYFDSFSTNSPTTPTPNVRGKDPPTRRPTSSSWGGVGGGVWKALIFNCLWTS